MDTQDILIKENAMSKSINLSINQDVVPGTKINTVDARELYVFLNSKQRFADWIKNRISEYSFEEKKDFFIILGKTPNGGRPRKEYAITLDMAKELCMVERTKKGRAARRYFIECEEKYRMQQNPAVSDPDYDTMKHFMDNITATVTKLERATAGIICEESTNSLFVRTNVVGALISAARAMNSAVIMAPGHMARIRNEWKEI